MQRKRDALSGAEVEKLVQQEAEIQHTPETAPKREEAPEDEWEHLRHCRRQLEQILEQVKQLTEQEQPPMDRIEGGPTVLPDGGLEADPELLEERQRAALYRKLAHLYVMEHDLQRIRRAFPKEKIDSLEQLGEGFFALRRGGIDPVVACAALMQGRGEGAPPEMGLLSGRQQEQQEYYTPAEVDRLTEQELKDPSVMAAVRWSMTRWKNR